ncbi:MAG: T9SS type A sorting domain-containing protein [Flavobacteriales bacterium]|nr:T9SS type A sorting domain-containing protein [Flavobacteriales bacterium]
MYVDFDRGDGSLIENAKALQAAINWINEEKAANCSTSDNILVGYSMGGVVARLALTYMEDDAEDHEVSYYVSVDSPHRGANVPRAVIAALIDIRNYHFDGFNVSEDVPGVEDAYQVLFSPAARQMLLYSGEGSNDLVTGHGPTYTSFQNHLHNEQGMPTQTLENIAVAKGGGTGVGQYGSMLPILDINTSTFNALSCFTDVPNVVGWFAGAFALLKLGLYAKVVIDINAMPGYVSNPLQIYERKIRLLAFTDIIPIPYFYWDSHETRAKNVNFYDGVQGGTYGVETFIDLDDEEDDLGQFINEVINGGYEPCLSLDQSKFAFIPTVSALDMGNFIGGTGAVSPNVQIDPITVVNNGETPFQKAFILDPTKYPSGFIAPVNESHNDLTPSNVFPFSTFIPPAFNTINNGTAVLGLTYNFGVGIESGEFVQTSDRLTTLIDVEEMSGLEGTVCINCDDRIDITALPSNPDNTADFFSVELTQGCDGDYGRLRINNGGNLLVGEDENITANLIVRNNSWVELNDGVIEVREGSKLIIDNGAELRLNSGSIKVFDGGEILIKEGGLLIFEDNVNLELNGNDAQLVLEGLTYVGDNATFGFSYTGTESGYIRIAKEGHWGERFAAGTNAEILLEGEDENDLILHLEESADFWEYEGSVPNQPFTSNRFQRVQFRDGKVYFEDDSRMVLRSKSKFYNCTISKEGYPAIVDGIVHFRKLEIIDSDVMSVDIESALHYYNEGALIGVNSNFNHSDVYVRGYGYYFRDCVMDHTKISADQSTIGNSVIRSTFQNSSELADFSTTELTVTNSTFTNNSGLYRRFGRATIKCSAFTNNHVAIHGSLGSIINMSTLYNGGYNYFDDNDYNIQIWDAHDLTLNQGYNELYDANIMNIYGTLDLNENVCPRIIYAYNNIWTPASGQGPIIDPDHPDLDEFDVTIQYNPNYILCNAQFKFGPVADIATCGEHDLPEGPKSNSGGGEKSNEPLPLVTTDYYFEDVPVNLALLEIASNTTVSDSLNGDDAVAADMYFELLSTVNTDSLESDSIKIIVESMLWNGLHSYKAAIERLLQTDAYSSALNQTAFQPVIEDYVSTLMQYTDSIKTPENYHKQFMLEMMKTTLFRNINKPEKSLQILVNIADCSHDSIQQILLDEMIQNVEFDIEANAIGEQSFLYDSLSFELDSSIYEIPLASFTDTTGFGTYINSPNALSFTACTEHTFAKISTNNSSYGAMNDYTIFPNPASTNLIVKKQVSDKAPAQPDIFELYDLSGRIVYSTPIPSTENFIELPNLGSGLYLFMIKNQSSLRETGKLTVINM